MGQFVKKSAQRSPEERVLRYAESPAHPYQKENAEDEGEEGNAGDQMGNRRCSKDLEEMEEREEVERKVCSFDSSCSFLFFWGLKYEKKYGYEKGNES
jgi:hypothetical protein